MSSIFDSILTGDMTLTVYLILLGSSIILGILNALASSFRNRSGRTFYSALVLLPPTVLTVVTMVNGNVGTGIAVAGSFSLLKFESAPAKARDLMSIFISMASGLCCAAGYVGIAFLFTVIMCSISMLLAVLNTTGAEKRSFRSPYRRPFPLTEHLTMFLRSILLPMSSENSKPPIWEACTGSDMR